MKNYKLFLTICVTIVVMLFSGCIGQMPTKEFFVNDFADVLLEGTRDVIILESKRLYNATKKSDIGKTKLVVVTDVYEKNSDLQKESDQLFKSWSLKDMDILIFMAFDKDRDKELYLNSVLIKIGDKMQNFVDTGYAVDITESTLFNPQWEGNLNLGMGHFYYEILSAIYKNAYGYESFEYDLEDYKSYIDNDGITTVQKPMTALGYIFSQYSPSWKKVLIISPVMLFSIGLYFVFRAKRKL